MTLNLDTIGTVTTNMYKRQTLSHRGPFAKKDPPKILQLYIHNTTEMWSLQG